MKKVSELFEERWRTVHERDASGHLERSRVKYKAKRMVRCVTTGTRFGHSLIDFLCFDGPMLLLQYVIISRADMNVLHPGVAVLSVVADCWFFIAVPAMYLMFEYKWQRTPGKFITRTRVIDEYGNPPLLSAVLLRTVIRWVPFEAFSCFGDPYSRGWHDKWSNTYVVPYTELAELKRLQSEQTT